MPLEDDAAMWADADRWHDEERERRMGYGRPCPFTPPSPPDAEGIQELADLMARTARLQERRNERERQSRLSRVAGRRWRGRDNK